MALLMLLATSTQADLVGLWHLDGDATDSSGYDNDGTISGASWVDGICGSALNFDGADDYVDCGSSATLKPTQDITIEMWVKPSSTQNTYADILGGHQNNQGYVVQQYVNTNQYCFAYNNDGTRTGWQGWQGSISTQLTADVWQHFVVQKEGSTIRHYLNGTLSASGSVSGDIYYSATEPFYIGIGWLLTSGRYFTGDIDEVRIYNHALTADEVASAAEGCGVIEVEIDIKPGSDTNSINPNAGGVIPVAILTTADFDASTVKPETVALEGAGARGKGKSGRYGSMEDVDGDGDLDLVVQIENVIEWEPSATEATLTGETYNGIAIQGTDTVNIVPPE